MTNSKVRLNVNVPAPVIDKMDKIADKEGNTRGDILRKAVLLLEAVKLAEEKGGRLVILSEEDGVKKETQFVGL